MPPVRLHPTTVAKATNHCPARSMASYPVLDPAEHADSHSIHLQVLILALFAVVPDVRPFDSHDSLLSSSALIVLRSRSQPFEVSLAFPAASYLTHFSSSSIFGGLCHPIHSCSPNMPMSTSPFQQGASALTYRRVRGPWVKVAHASGIIGSAPFLLVLLV